MYLITGTGYYRQAYHPRDVADMNIADIEGRFLAELESGMDGTDIRAGLIGELGTTGASIQPEEKRVLAGSRPRSASNECVDHGAYEWLPRCGPRRLRHPDDQWRQPGEGPHLPRQRRTMVEGRVDRGVTGASGPLWFDFLGRLGGLDENPTDQTRIDELKAQIADAGHGDRVLMSNDICMKMRLHKYGGWGYDHIQTNLVPHMLRAGFVDADVKQLFVDTPKRLLDTAA